MKVEVTTLVTVDPATAFEVFTAEVDRWWKRGPRYRFGGGVMEFKDGRFRERYAGGGAHDHGAVLVWEPGRRLSFEMRGRAGETTDVEVTFQPEGEGTRVTVVHRGWDRLPPDHPAFGGLDPGAFRSVRAMWWADLLRALPS